jgi:putative flavoprotein involved in K+ transport
MADYLEQYTRTFALPVRTGTRVERLSRMGSRDLVVAGDQRFDADNVVVAMGSYQRPRRPAFGDELDSGIVQLHSFEYRNLSQFQPGDVLIAGAGNSGSEIAMEAVKAHRIWMAGRDTGHIPFRIEGFLGRNVLVRLVLRGIFHRVLSVDTPIGRRVRPKVLHGGGPLIRVKPKDLAAAGVMRVGRVSGTTNGRPRLEDGRVLDVANVVWCTGFDPGFSWIDLPVFDGHGDVIHHRGVIENVPGLYFVGLKFLYSALSEALLAIGRAAGYVVENLISRRIEKTSAAVT